jgi:hypothetical protein
MVIGMYQDHNVCPHCGYCSDCRTMVCKEKLAWAIIEQQIADEKNKNVKEK